MDRFKVGDRVRYLGVMWNSRTEYIGRIGTVMGVGVGSCAVTWDNKCPGISNPRIGNIALATDNIPEEW